MTTDNLDKLHNKRKVCFSCLNSYHLFISYILSKTVYKHDYKILILSDYLNILKIAHKNIINRFDIWNEVRLISDTTNAARHHQLKKIDFEDLDVLHYFTYGLYSGLLFDYIKEKTKIILTDEGLMTYLIKESLEARKNKTIDIERISEIWVLNKNLYVSNFKRTIKNIEIEKHLNDNQFLTVMCKELNEIYNYNHKKINANIIFFDQPLTKVHLTTEEKERQIITKIFHQQNYDKFLIKKHPSDFYAKYRRLNLSIIKNDIGVPWELVLLNEYIHNRSNLYNKIFISYYSAGLINSKILLNLFKIPCKSIFLYRFLEKELERTIVRKNFEKFLDRFKNLDEKNVHDIKSIEELQDFLKEL